MSDRKTMHRANYLSVVSYSEIGARGHVALVNCNSAECAAKAADPPECSFEVVSWCNTW